MRPLILFLLCVTACAQNNQQAILIARPQSAGGAEPVLTHIQGALGTSVATGTTTAVTLATDPATGNAVTCAVVFFPTTLTITSVQDANGNAYTATANSPNTTNASARGISIYYLLNAGGTANKTITATFNSTITFTTNIRCEEFHRVSGSWTLGNNATAQAAAGGTTINLPSLTGSATGSLFYSSVTTSSAAFITAVGGGWTQDAGGIEPTIGQNDGEYILSSASGATAINFTANATATWNALALELK